VTERGVFDVYRVKWAWLESCKHYNAEHSAGAWSSRHHSSHHSRYTFQVSKRSYSLNRGSNCLQPTILCFYHQRR